MKKMILMAAMMVATLGASAQARFEPGTLSIQPKLGGTGAMLTNMESVSGINGDDIDAVPTGGAFIGAEFEYQFTNRLSLAAGVNWAQAGSGWEDSDMRVNGVKVKVNDFKVETSYVNIPLTANVYLFKGFAVKAGAQFSFLTSAKMKYTFSASQGGSHMNTEVDRDIKDEFNKFDFSIPVGISYEFPVPIVLDLRYNIGITKVNKKSGDDYKDSRNMVAAFTVGYKFKL